MSFCVFLLTLCLMGHDCLTFMSDRSCLSFWFWSGHLHVVVNVLEVVFYFVCQGFSVGFCWPGHLTFLVILCEVVFSFGFMSLYWICLLGHLTFLALVCEVVFTFGFKVCWVVFVLSGKCHSL